ncbi:MAG: DUF3488 and transglutaminase-like domain-containing protein [Syntrophorhabdaceae bacterium]|nr:DUF3488 and transglutaminase-like domain-containing protein [Syntrophorhabdaceae bacterium]
MKSIELKTIRIETIVKLLTYIIGIIGFLSVYRYINILYSASFILLFIISMYFEYKKTFYIPRWVINILSVLVVIFTIYRINTEELITQIIEALLIIYAVKFLEEKKVRDYMQIYTLTLFLLAGMGLMSLDIVFSVFLIIVVIMLSTSFVLLTFFSQDHEMEFTRQVAVKVVLKSLYIPGLAIPLTVVMFIILPRTQYPIFDFLNRPDKAKTGFTNKVRLGAVSNIQEDSSVIFRVNMDKINDDELYWRGIVLDYFDGVSWSATDKVAVPHNVPVSAPGKTIRQTIYLEPYSDKYIFALDKPAFISIRGVKRFDDLTFRMSFSIERRLRYEALSILSDTLIENEIEQEDYLQLPESISQDVRGLAGRLMKNKDKMEYIYELYRFFNDGSFRYSLKNLPFTRSPLDDFLFKNRYGNCEYFASAFAVMLRLGGIPARLVGGYRGGYYNDVGRYYLVPQKNAHVWVEAFIDKKGWIRFDPTPASIENFALLKKGSPMMRLRLALDTINYYWYSFVINYNLDRQLSIIFSIRSGIKRPSIKLNLKNWWVYTRYLLCFLVAGALILLALRRYRLRKNVDMFILHMFLKKMKRYGYEKKTSQGLEEFVKGIKDGPLKERGLTFVRQFEGFYYKDIKPSREDIKKMKEAIKRLRP